MQLETRKRIGFSVLIVAALSFTAGCMPESGPAVDLVAEEQAVRAVSESWQAFDQALNASGAASLFAPDGTVAWQGRQPASGSEVEAYLQEGYSFSPSDPGSWGGDRIDVAASGDLAVEHGSFQNSTDSGRYLTVYRKIGTDWKVGADMSVETAPHGGAPAWAVETLTEWYAAYNGRDAERIADAYADDAHIRDAQGRRAIIESFKTGWAENDDVCSGDFDGFEVVGPIGVGWGRDTCKPREGDGSAVALSNWLAVYEQQDDGSWLCTRDFAEDVE